jgi:hypothetical protein
MPATLQSPTSEDLLFELQALEKMLEAESIQPKVLVIRNAIAAKKAELDEQRRIEAQASTERRAAEDQATLQDLEQRKDSAWALVQALRLELTEVQKRLAVAEFDFSQCLRTRGEVLRAQGKGN